MSEKELTHEEFIEAFFLDNERCRHCFCESFFGKSMTLQRKCCRCGARKESPREFGKKLAEMTLNKFKEQIKL